MIFLFNISEIVKQYTQYVSIEENILCFHIECQEVLFFVSLKTHLVITFCWLMISRETLRNNFFTV